MNVAGKHDRIGYLVFAQSMIAAVFSDIVTSPLIHTPSDVFKRIAVDPRHHDLLGQDVPSGLGIEQAFIQPSLLRFTKYGCIPGKHSVAGRLVPITTGLRENDTAWYPNMNLGQIAIWNAAIQLQVWAVGTVTCACMCS